MPNQYCWTFNTRYLDTTTDGITAISGQNLGETAQSDDAIPIYRQGKWFDGGDFLRLDPLLLNASWTIMMWIQPHEVSGTLFSTDNTTYNTAAAEEVFKLVLSGTSLRFEYKMGQFSIGFTDP